MRTVTARITGRSPYSQSKYHNLPKNDKESAADYNLRTWKSQCTTTDDGEVAIPAMAVKMALDSVAKKLKDRIPGKGTKTYIDFFVGGVIPADLMFPIGIKLEDVGYIDIWANADGVRGSGKRVMRRFPLFPQWEAEVSLHIVDDSIPNPVVERYLSEAGKIVGIGRFRPERGGFNGRFTVSDVRWTNGV